MPAPDAIDQYFTRSICGTVQALNLGPSEPVRTVSARSGWVEVLRGRTELAGRAAHSLLAADPAAQLLGWPLQVQALLKTRRRLLGAAALAWAVLVAGLTYWVVR